MPVYLFGHSAGGQFLSRVAAYQPPAGVMRFVIANPSSHVRASLTDDAPFGFRGVSNGEALLRQYLALPITIYLGEDDEDPSDPDLSTRSAAVAQGPHRLARGRFVFNEAKNYAENNHLPFNWRLVITNGVGHTADGMLRSEAAPSAFAP
jgi:pimeloyl-ACP methyl ester carboxylesterase